VSKSDSKHAQYLRERYARLKAEGGERYQRMLAETRLRTRGLMPRKRPRKVAKWRLAFEESLRKWREERIAR
jgi:hypothetical protein